MSTITDEDIQKARHTAHVPSEDGFFSENATRRWQNANLPTWKFVDANNLYQACRDSSWLWAHMTSNIWIHVSAGCAALGIFCIELTSLRFDVCLCVAYNMAYLLYTTYLWRSGRSFGHMNARELHIFGRQTLLYTRWVWSYIVLRCAITIIWRAPYVALTIGSSFILKNLTGWQWPPYLATYSARTLEKLSDVSNYVSNAAFIAAIKLKSLPLHLQDKALMHLQRLRSSNCYEYGPLADGEIRLLHLPRRLPFRMVQARLSVVSLEKAPIYEAISYTWGDHAKRKLMLLNGKFFETTSSARDALLAHSSWWRPKVVWIDQICINQADDKEKGRQVAMMFNIYRRADRVVAHLGTSLIAFAALAMLGELMWQEYQDSELEIAGFLATVPLFGGYFAIAEMLRHPWFSRVWIVQEVAAARELAVAYGGILIDWESMASAIRVLSRPGIRDLLILNSEDVEGVTQSIGNILELTIIAARVREARAGGRVIEVKKLTAADSLPSLLGRTIRFMATDPRDRIYALQSLALPTRLPHESPLHLEYDYTLQVEVLYLTLAIAVLFEFPDPFYMMSYAGLDKRGALDLPSWCPDWTMSHKWKISFTSRHDPQDLDLVRTMSKLLKAGDAESDASVPTHKGYGYRAGGASRPVKTLEGTSLVVLGVRVGVITNVTQAAWPDVSVDKERYDDRHHQTIFPSRAKKVKAWFNEANDIAAQVYSDPEIREDAFWRTLVGDRWKDMRPAPDEGRLAYAAWMVAQAAHSFVCAQLDAGLPDVEVLQDQDLMEARTYEASWLTEFCRCAAHRAFASVADRYVAIVPQGTQVGDVVVVPLGARTPWVLRPSDVPTASTRDQFQFVGEAYVHGLMDGECVTPGIALLSIGFAKSMVREEEHPSNRRREEPPWVDFLVDRDLMHGEQSMGDLGSINVEDLLCRRPGQPLSITG